MDLISRQAAIEVADAVWSVTGDKNVAKVWDQIKDLPSAQPERKTGHWIKTARWGRVYYCDQCRNYLDFDGVNVGRGSTKFCPNCGAKMDEEGKDD